MAIHDTSASDGDGSGRRSTARRATPGLGKLSRDGSLATVTGGATLLWAARTARKNAGRATLLTLAGAILLGIGRRQRRACRNEDAADTGVEVSLDDEDGKRVSDDAHVQATEDLGADRNADESRSDVQSSGEFNPRGTADGADVQQDDGGEFDFVDGKEPGTHRQTHLEGEHDTRLDTDDGDERTEIDLSEAAMADEASEAAGPHPEQAFPAREGTDPEPKSEKAPPRSNEGVESAAEAGSDVAENEESESEEHDGDTATEEASDEPVDTS